jgi:hypothetical protein
VQENNEVGGKFFHQGRVLDFAVCLRLMMVGSGGRRVVCDVPIGAVLTPEILRFAQDDKP